jgi:beta-lactamase superfamily II metal-dependent hydrolase
MSSHHSSRSDQGGTPWTPAAGEVGIRVRMYRVGFGDFFLISCLNGNEPPLHIIVDCGVYRGSSQTGDLHSIEAAVADMAQTTGGRIALIVMTHRHADHIAGFDRCADIFRKLKVDAVWMPIWESEYEPIALKYQAELTRAALGLRQHFSALGDKATEAQAIARAYMENATGEQVVMGAAAAGPGSNARALDLLKHGFAGVTPEYYKFGDEARLPKELVDAGLSCEILGPPPATDLDLMKLMDLQKNVGQYLAGAGDTLASAEWAPFGPEWEIDPAVEPKNAEREFYTTESFREWNDERKSWGAITEKEAARARLKMEANLQQLQPLAALTAAKQLNAFLNNQSLVVLFKFKSKNLLFVGDAQAGNWEHWLFRTDIPDKKAGGTVSPAAQQILTSLDFYKVGHHGSGNATPKVAAETMGKQRRKFVSLCSTQADVYGKEDPDDSAKGTEVPRLPLLEKLASESALVRSDQIPITANKKKIEPKVAAPLPPSPPGSRLEKGALWVDCYL